MVTWGTNQTQTFNTAAPAAQAGQAPAPSGSSFSFGSTTASPAPGTTAAPSPGGLFGAPAPAPSGGLFGAPAPATGTTSGFGGFGATAPAASAGGLFGAKPPVPAPSPGGLFGAPAPSPGGLFGAPAPSPGGLFGSTAPTPAPAAFGSSSLFAPVSAQQPQQQQQPAQAAMQAHIDASARQEELRIMSAIEKLHVAYSGAPPKDSKDKSSFVCIVYSDITPEHRQLQYAMGDYEGITPPLKPPHVTEKEWTDAVVKNPDPKRYMPVALVGADNLRLRVAWQQERAKSLADGVSKLHQAHDTVRDKCDRFQKDVESLARTHATLRKRLLDVMKKVEIVRCMNQPLQSDEVVAGQRLSDLIRHVDKVGSALVSIQNKVQTQTARSSIISNNTDQMMSLPDEKQLFEILKEQREGIESLTETLKRDRRDMNLLQQRIAPTVPAPPRHY